MKPWTVPPITTAQKNIVTVSQFSRQFSWNPFSKGLFRLLWQLWAIYWWSRQCRLWEARQSSKIEKKVLCKKMEERTSSVDEAVICLWGAAALALAASAKQYQLISCCLQEAAVFCCFCCRYYSEPLVINLLHFNWSAPHCDGPAHTHTHTDRNRRRHKCACKK